MSIHRREIDRETAERLLSGDPTAAAAGVEPLANLLAAAAAPGQAAELAGEHAALTAFRMARRLPVVQPRSRSMFKTAVGRILTAKVAAVVAATAIGGVAVAASTGNLPTQHESGTAQRTSNTAQPQLLTPPETGGSPSAAAPRADGDHSAAPSPSMVGLCRAFAAGAGDNPGKALENPAFTALITAAGGKEKVTGFCASVLAEAQAAQRPSGARTDHPTGSPEQHPTGRPTTHPTAPNPHPVPPTPTSHPTGP